jgi:predicted nucleotidyltransferase
VDRKTFAEWLGRFLDWAASKPDITAALLVGSYAIGKQGPDSDIDLVLLCENPDLYLNERSWTRKFGDVYQLELEDYRRARSLRVWYRNWSEVEFTFTTPDWVDMPLDPGTMQVLEGGFRILLDRDGLLEKD